MENMKLVLLILGILLFAYATLKKFIFRTKDTVLVMEDEALKSKQNDLKTEVEALKKLNELKNLTPEEIEEFWKENKKK